MSRHVKLIVVVLAAAGVLVGCSDDPPAGTPSTTSTTTPGVTVAIPGTPTAAPSMELAGKWYPIPVAQCMQKVWDDRVAEWNRLVQQRDANGATRVVVDGKAYDTSEQWMKARGWPTTFEATVRSPATIRACASAR